MTFELFKHFLDFTDHHDGHNGQFIFYDRVRSSCRFFKGNFRVVDVEGDQSNDFVRVSICPTIDD